MRYLERATRVHPKEVGKGRRGERVIFSFMYRDVAVPDQEERPLAESGRQLGLMGW